MATSSPDRPLGYRALQAVLRGFMLLFFRKVYVWGLENVPREGGGIVVSWHPNGLIDPGLVLTQLPRRVVFGARHGLFSWPLLGHLMRAIGTVPIYRASDLPNVGSEARREANQKSLDALSERIASGSFSALFPEGISHSESAVQELKTGAARLFLAAVDRTPVGSPPPVIVPVGLHYDDKQVFRSHALVAFHPPLELAPDLLRPAPDEPPDQRRHRARALTDEIERVLHDVVRATESWELHELMHRARKIVRAERASRSGAEPGRTKMQERVVGFARVWTGYQTRLRTHPELVAAMTARVAEYNADLRALGLEDHDLDRNRRLASPWLWTILGAQIALLFLFLPPILLLGYLANAPTALLLLGISRRFALDPKDEATIKALGGLLLFPASWIAVGILAAWGHSQLHLTFPNLPNHPVLAGVSMALLSALGGAVALRYLRFAGETLRAVRVRWKRFGQDDTLVRLKKERAWICDSLLAMVEGVELPGEVGPDGRVRGRL